MSASLVGSEMCIRDRLGSTKMSCEDSGISEVNRWRLVTCDRLGHCHEIPVSYTHLTLPTICSV
eukprot:7739653-Alexandrium_andersonii.AAC.1